MLRALNGSSGNHKGIRSLVKEDAKEDEGLADRLMAFHKLIHQASDDLDNPAKTMEARSTVETLHSALDSWLKGKSEAAEPAHRRESSIAWWTAKCISGHRVV